MNRYIIEFHRRGTSMWDFDPRGFKSYLGYISMKAKSSKSARAKFMKLHRDLVVDSVSIDE